MIAPFRLKPISLTILMALPLTAPAVFAETAAESEKDSTVDLPRMDVSGTGALGLTENTGSYTIGRVNSSTRLGLSIRDTPQTVTVVTRQQIEDFGYQSMDDVLGAVSGVYTYNRGLNGGAYFSRGFNLQTQYDGIQNPWGISEFNRNPSPDTAILDHVEVVQGASGLLTGAGDPGGVVNMIRKMPTYTPQASFEVSGGSWDYQRAVADFSGPLIDSGRLRGRVVGAYQKQNSYVDEEFSNRRVFYGVLEADLTDTTTVSANIQIQNNNYNDDFGVIKGPNGQDLGFSRSRFFGADFSDMTKENHLYTLRLDQQLKN
ncbi:MAG: TonB-dependent receptor plug domain-containing protein, partial [Methylophaga sp.]